MLLLNKLNIGFIIFFYVFSNQAIASLFDSGETTSYSAIRERRPLNILFVVQYFPAPSQTYVLNMITGLIDNGHNVLIFALSENSSVGAQSEVEKYGLLDRVIYEQLPEELPDCDIVFCQNGFVGRKILEVNRLAEWLNQRKLVVCLRGGDITMDVKDNPNLYVELFQSGDLFLPVCDYFKKKLITLGCNSDKIIVYHSAINCSQFEFKNRKKTNKDILHFVSVCRLIQKKGIDFAIKALAIVIKKYKKVHFTVVGDGCERAHLEALIKKLKMENYVTLFGWGTQKEVIEILDKSHIFLLPSRTSRRGSEEGIANALKEAMAMGLISIATWHAGTPELIDDGVSGFLVPEKNSKELAKKIEYVIEHPEMWESVALAARKKIENEFETKKSVQQLEQIFYGLLNEHSMPEAHLLPMYANGSIV